MPPVDRLTNLACSIKQSSYKIITTSTYTISSSKVPISLLNLSRYSSLANICLSKASLHLGAWSYQSKGSISGGYDGIFITKKYNNINGGISTIHVYWSNQRPTFFKNTLLINSTLSQNYKQQMEFYPLKYYYIKSWQSHTPSSKPWKSHTPSSKPW